MATNTDSGRAMLWSQFMAAALSNQAATHSTASDAAQIADRAMEEFDKRWRWTSDSFGSGWQRREQVDGQA